MSMAYYGVILNVGHLGDNFYLNLGLMAVVEYPGKLFSLFLLTKFGRKPVYIGYMLIGGLLCVGTIYPVIDKDAGTCMTFYFADSLMYLLINRLIQLVTLINFSLI